MHDLITDCSFDVSFKIKKNVSSYFTVKGRKRKIRFPEKEKRTLCKLMKNYLTCMV